MFIPARAAIRIVVIAGLAASAACGSRTMAPDPPSPPVIAAPGDETERPAEPASPEPDQPVAQVEAPAPACSIGPDDGAPVESVGLGQRVAPANAPHPTNDAERLVFRQLYETPLRLDCEGTLRPGLAAIWQMEPDRGAWILTIRPEARFTDGTPVTVASVLAAWTADSGDALRPEVQRHVTAVDVLDDQRLSLVLRSPAQTPTVLADPDLAVFRRAPDDAWPLGTTLWRVLPDPATSAAGGPMHVTLAHSPGAADLAAAAAGPRVLVFTIASGADGRDLLDAGVDLLITDDPAVLGYAASLPQYASLPLPWDRTALFVSRAGGPVQPLAADARSALARAGVRSEARGAEGPFWWEATASCEAPPAPSPLNSAPERRIVYDRDDRAGRDLAERIVGLVGSRAGEAVLAALLPQRAQVLQRAVGLTGATLGTARRRGNDAGYIVTLPRRPAAPCAALASLLAQFPWLDPATLVPLVDTRQRAIIRTGRTGLFIDGSGRVTIDAAPGARRSAE